MSEQLRREVEAAHHEMLMEQRDCAWCGKHCESANHLTIHIMLRHPKDQRDVLTVK